MVTSNSACVSASNGLSVVEGSTCALKSKYTVA